MKTSYFIGLVALLFLFSPLTYAENEWARSAEFGFTQTSGNSEQSTIKARFDAERDINDWRYNFHLDMMNTTSKGIRSAENYFMTNRFGYLYNAFDYLYLYHSANKDRFSGYEYQSTVSVGYGRRLIDTEHSVLDMEIGPGYRFAKLYSGSNENESILRAYANYNIQLTSNTEFDQTLNIEKGFDLTTSRSSSTFKINVASNLSVRLGYHFLYSDKVPRDSKHADTETSVTVVYDF